MPHCNHAAPYDGTVGTGEVIEGVVEVLGWVGLGLGLPLLVIAWLWHLSVGHWQRQEMTVTDAGFVRWYREGEFYERRLRDGEASFDVGWHEGWVSVHHPDKGHLHQPGQGVRAAFLVGGLLSAVGVLALVIQVVQVVTS